jgi:hypothetical protein
MKFKLLQNLNKHLLRR